MFSWQTLIAGVFATLAAAVSVNAIYRQIHQAELVERNRSERQNFAARAAIHQPLSNIIGKQRNHIEQFTQFIEEFPPKKHFDEKLQICSLEASDMQYLIDCIVDADDKAAADLSELLSSLQIQNARLEALNSNGQALVGHSNDRRNILEYAIQALVIFARANRLLLYARRQDEDYRNMSFRELMRSTCSIYCGRLGVKFILARRFRRSADQWLFPAVR